MQEPAHFYTNKEARGRILELPKVAATYSPTMQRSTIGDAELNDPVRNGKGWDLSAITTLIYKKWKIENGKLKINSIPNSNLHKGLTYANVKLSQAKAIEF